MSQKTLCSQKQLEGPRDIFQRSGKRRNAIIIPESSKQNYYFQINSLKNLQVFEQQSNISTNSTLKSLGETTQNEGQNIELQESQIIETIQMEQQEDNSV